MEKIKSISINLLKVLERESNNKNHIFLYQQENGKWIAFEQSAWFLSFFYPNIKCTKKIYQSFEVILVSAEINDDILNKRKELNSTIQNEDGSIVLSIDLDLAMLAWKNKRPLHQN